MSLLCMLGLHAWQGCECGRCGKCNLRKANALLERAAAAGDYSEVRRLTACGANVNLTPKGTHSTLLERAAHGGNTGVVRALLEHGAKIGEALHAACWQGSPRVVAMLLEHGADVGARNKILSETALHKAAWQGNPRIVVLLLQHGADASATDRFGKTAVQRIEGRGKKLSEGTWMNNLSEGAEAFEAAGVIRSMFEEVEQMLRNAVDGQSILIQPKKGLVHFSQRAREVAKSTGLYFCRNCKVADGGAGGHGARSLFFVGETLPECERCGPHTLWKLTESEVVLQMSRSAPAPGTTPLSTPSCAAVSEPELDEQLFEAVRQGDTSAIRALVGKGANVNAVATGAFSLDRTPIHFAAVGRPAAVACLIELGANPAAQAGNGITPLHTAAKEGSLETIQLLVRSGVPVDAINADGVSPLHLAAYKGHMEVCRSLVAVGANPLLANRNGETPIDAAKIGGHEELVRLLGSSKS